MSRSPQDRQDLNPQISACMSESLKPYELSSGQRESMRSRILRIAQAPAPQGTRTLRFDEGDWQNLMPLVEMKVLRRDVEKNNQTVLYRLHPGAIFPSHMHTQQEECLVLEGEINCGDHYVRKGDMHIAEAGCEHPAITSKTGALLLVRAEIGEQPHP